MITESIRKAHPGELHQGYCIEIAFHVMIINYGKCYTTSVYSDVRIDSCIRICYIFSVFARKIKSTGTSYTERLLICSFCNKEFVFKVVNEFNKKLNLFRLSFLLRGYKSIFLITNRQC